jgi:hypothetical protein
MLCFLRIACWTAVVLAGAPGMAQNTIDFSKGANLKTIYDAGLRPWRVGAEERGMLFITEQKVRILTPGASPFNFDVEIGTFKILAENKLSKADFIGHPMSLLDAKAKAHEVCAALGLSTDGLDQSVSNFLRLGNQSPPPQYWSTYGEINGIRCALTFHPLFGFNETRAKVYVFFDFHKPGEPMKFLSKPITPPPGYEGVSMDPPPRNPNQKPVPDPAENLNMLKRVQQLQAKKEMPQLPGPSTANEKPQSPAEVKTEDHFDWFLMLASIAVIALAGGVALRFLRK